MIQQTSKQLTLCVNIPLIYIYIGESSWCYCLSRRKPFKQVDSSGGTELPEPRDKKALAFSSVSLAVSVHSVVRVGEIIACRNFLFLWLWFLLIKLSGRALYDDGQMINSNVINHVTKDRLG